MSENSLSKALEHHKAGRLGEAERLYRKTLAANPRHPDARRLLAVVKHQTGRAPEALADLDSLLAEHPFFPEAMANRAVTLAALGRPDEAEAAFRLVLSQLPGFKDAFGPLLRLLLAEDRLDEAERLLADARDGWAVERALLAQKQGRPDRALAVLEGALAKHPGQATLLAAMVPVLTILGRQSEAIEAGSAALALEPGLPGVRHNLAMAHLSLGQLGPGWAAFAERWQSPVFPSHRRSLKPPPWDGRFPLAGKTALVWREQGIGDEITFVSALPDLIDIAGKVVLECSPKLVALFARSFPKACVRPENRQSDPEALGIDAHLPMGDLFAHLRPTLASFAARPYLTADPQLRSRWRLRLRKLGPGPKIGIAWKSTLSTALRAPTFLPSLSELDPLLGVPGVQFVNLQPKADPAEIEAARVRTGASIHHFDDLDLFDDLEGSAALMAELDKVAAIGTATAILSAALGTPTGMFLLRHAQWDPMGGEVIPWLPNHRLFRRAWNESWSKAAIEAAAWLGGDGGRLESSAGPEPEPAALPRADRPDGGVEHMLDQATAAHLRGDFAKAAALYRALLSKKPDSVEALVNLAAILDEGGALQGRAEAVELLRQAQRLSPREPAIPDNLGRLLLRLGRIGEAVPVLELALRLEPGNAGVMNDLGNALRLLNRMDESLAWLLKAEKLAGGAMPVRFNLAKTLRELGRCKEALDRLLAIENPDPATLWEIGATRLQMGDLAGGWAGIEYRPGGLMGRRPDWRGRKVLVKAEQGVGDFLIYGQALADLMAGAASVALEAPLKLHPLLARSFPGLALIETGKPLPKAEIVLPLGSLFGLLRPGLESFVNAQPFLRACPEKTRRWRERLAELGSGFKLGLAWRSTEVTPERARHFPGSPERLSPLLDLQGWLPVNLQAKAEGGELRGLAVFPDLDLYDDLDETAALVTALDAVAVNGSAIGMLAGALGAPTALLLRAHASWDRLGTQRLPWLPAARLFDCAWNESWESAAAKAAQWIRTLPARSNV